MRSTPSARNSDSGGLTSNDEREQTLNQLLTEMDGFDGKKGVVILAATNRPESLDKALASRPLRSPDPGGAPDLQGREAILRVHAQDVKLGPDIDFNAIARATAGASGAELANIVNEAVSARCPPRTLCCYAGGSRGKRRGYYCGLPEKERRHRAKGKADCRLPRDRPRSCGCQADRFRPVHKITIIPRTSGALGYTMQVSEDESVLMSREEIFNKIATLTGGRSAEELIFGTCTSGASNDIEQATKLARSMITRLGMSDRFGMIALETEGNKYLGGESALACSEGTAREVDEEAISLINKAHEKAISILKENLPALHELASLPVGKGNHHRRRIYGYSEKYDTPAALKAERRTTKTGIPPF